jgi:hypothetical protein
MLASGFAGIRRAVVGHGCAVPVKQSAPDFEIIQGAFWFFLLSDTNLRLRLP